MKKLNYIFAIFVTALFTACQSDENLPVQYPDGYNDITFRVGMETLDSRAHDHENYDPQKHPQTMGAFGYHDLDKHNFSAATPNYQILGNEEVQYVNATSGWVYDNKQHWADYASFDSFDFFGYMPYVDVASITKDAGNYKLSANFELSSPVILDTKSAPLICHTPKHKDVVGGSVELIMDQTLTAYQLQFKLGDRMDAVRDFKITKVEILGSNLPYKGVVSRTYSLKGGGAWIEPTDAEPNFATWTITPADKKDIDTPVEIVNGTEAPSAPITISGGAKTYTSWGKPFYAIPDNSFTPTIRVTYDVITNNTEGTDDGEGNITPVTTRKDVVSTIVLNSTNFKGFTHGNPGKVHPVQILIVPSYLYVLADADQHAGIIVVPTPTK